MCVVTLKPIIKALLIMSTEYENIIMTCRLDSGSLKGLVRQLSIDQFENEGRRVAMHNDSVGRPAMRTPLFERTSSGTHTGLHKVG